LTKSSWRRRPVGDRESHPGSLASPPFVQPMVCLSDHPALLPHPTRPRATWVTQTTTSGGLLLSQYPRATSRASTVPSLPASLPDWIALSCASREQSTACPESILGAPPADLPESKYRACWAQHPLRERVLLHQPFTSCTYILLLFTYPYLQHLSSHIAFHVLSTIETLSQSICMSRLAQKGRSLRCTIYKH
jgi:hypothetical protein